MPSEKKRYKGQPAKCRNCKVGFIRKREDQDFCAPVCRKEFHRYGKLSVSTIRELAGREMRRVLSTEKSLCAQQVRILDEKLETLQVAIQTLTQQSSEMREHIEAIERGNARKGK